MEHFLLRQLGFLPATSRRWHNGVPSGGRRRSVGSSKHYGCDLQTPNREMLQCLWISFCSVFGSGSPISFPPMEGFHEDELRDCPHVKEVMNCAVVHTFSAKAEQFDHLPSCNVPSWIVWEKFHKGDSCHEASCA